MTTRNNDELILAARAASIKKVEDARARVIDWMTLGRDLEWSLMNDIAEAQYLERIWMQVDSLIAGVEPDGADAMTPTDAHQAVVDRLTERLVSNSYAATSSDGYSNALTESERKVVSRFVQWMVW